MSDLELLKRAIDILSGVSIPVSYTEQIAIPVTNARNMIKAVYDAVVKQLEEKQAVEETSEAATDEN